MSLGYAERLSYREEVGAVGGKELLDEPAVVERKACELAELLRKAKTVLVMTGAGISTSAGIPDFRGPHGVWTCQKLGRPLPKLDSAFATARPTYTHMAIKALVDAGKVQYVVSQNVDGLHRRSGVKFEQLAEVHGNCFSERCPSCGAYYLRDFEMPSVGHKRTGRVCTVERCRGKLVDFVLDWDDALPEEQLVFAEKVATASDLVLCLGTSLQIRPICNLPLRTKRAGGAFAIVNLQKTPKHKQATLVLHERCDDVLRRVMPQLKISVPAFLRKDRLSIRAWTDQKRADGKAAGLVIAISSCHGFACPLPMVQAVRWRACAAAIWRQQQRPDVVGIKREKPDGDAQEHEGGKHVKRGAAGQGVQKEIPATAGSPIFLVVDEPESCLSGEWSVQVQVTVQLQPAADPELRCQTFSMSVVHARCATCPPRCSVLSERMWTTAAPSAAIVQLTSQVCTWQDEHEVPQVAQDVVCESSSTILFP